MGFILPLFYLLLSNATTVCIFKKKFIKVLPITLMFIVFPLFISGVVFSTFKIGIMINLLYCLCFIPYLLIKKENRKEFKDNYLSLGLIAFFVLYVFVYLFDLNRNFTVWDEFSHWGVMLKEMLRLDNFYSVTKSTLMVHKDYPPVLQLFEFFWIKLCGSYREAYAIRALHFFELSFILSFINEVKELNKKNILITVFKTILLILISLLCLLYFDLHGIMNSIYNDYSLSILVTYILYIILSEKDSLSNYVIINISLVSTFLLLTKQVSIAFYMMILFIYVLKLIKVRKELDFKKIVKILLLIIIVPLLLFKAWNIYIDQFEMAKQFLLSDIKISELKDVILNVNHEKHVVYTRYINAIFNYRISVFSIFNITYFNGFMIFSLLLFILSFKIKNIKKSDLLIYYITLFIGTVGYAFMMFVLYVFCFKEEGYSLASFDRYMGTYLLIEFLSLLLLLMKSEEEKFDIKKYIVLVLCLFILQDNTSIKKLKPDLSKNGIREEEIYANKIKNKLKDNDRVFILAQDSIGQYQFFVKYYAGPITTNLEYFSLNTKCDVCNSKGLEKYLKEYDYVFVVNTTDEVNQKYKVFENVKNNELYKINTNLSLELVK